jgi:hypothetical protein
VTLNATQSMRHQVIRPGKMKYLVGVLAFSWAALTGLVAAEITIESRTVAIPENGSVSSVIVRTAQSEVSLIPPSNWRLTIDTNTTTLTWQTRDFRTMLRLHLVPGPTGVASVNKEALRRRVRVDFPDAEIMDESECFTANLSGTGFELEQRKTQFPSVTRLAFVPYDGGMLELQVTFPVDDREQIRPSLTSVMNSLRITPR